jgi:hypothetical protein
VNFPVRLFDLTRGTGYVLVIYLAGTIGPDRIDSVEKMASKLKAFEDVTIRTVVITSPEAAIPDIVGASVFRDREKAFFSAYASADHSAFLIRPDGYIGYHARPITEAGLLKYLQSIGLRPIN